MGNFSSTFSSTFSNNHIELLSKFNSIISPFHIYIDKIKHFKHIDKSNQIPLKILNSKKNIAIKKIKLLKEEWNNEWLKYDAIYFKNNSIKIIEELVKRKQKNNNDNMIKCSMIYDEFVESLNIKHEIDTTIYK
jgi:hypothetical protein